MKKASQKKLVFDYGKLIKKEKEGPPFFTASMLPDKSFL
jgi:hypothetical protein